MESQHPGGYLETSQREPKRPRTPQLLGGGASLIPANDHPDPPLILSGTLHHVEHRSAAPGFLRGLDDSVDADIAEFDAHDQQEQIALSLEQSEVIDEGL